MKRSIIFIAVLFLFSPIAAFSQAYIGATLGQSDVGYGVDEDVGYSVFGGYRFNKYFALEAGYVDYGDFDDDIAPIWTLSGDALDIAALGILPITDQFEFFAKVGFSSWDIKVTEAGYGKIAGLDGEDVNYGAGFSYRFTKRFGMSVGYHQYTFKAFGEEDDMDYTYVGAKYYFGPRSRSATATKSPQVETVSYESRYGAVSFRAVSETEKSGCAFIKTITSGSGGPGDSSYHAENAMNKAMAQVGAAGGDSYYLVNMESTEKGASVVLEALDCN